MRATIHASYDCLVPPPLICEQGYTQGRIRAGRDFPVPIPQCACWDTGELRCTRFARSREPMNASPPLFLEGRQKFRAIFDSGEFCFPGPPLHPYLREMICAGCNAGESRYTRSIKCLAPPSPPSSSPPAFADENTRALRQTQPVIRAILDCRAPPPLLICAL